MELVSRTPSNTPPRQTSSYCLNRLDGQITGLITTAPVGQFGLVLAKWDNGTIISYVRILKEEEVVKATCTFTKWNSFHHILYRWKIKTSILYLPIVSQFIGIVTVIYSDKWKNVYIHTNISSLVYLMIMNNISINTQCN